MPGPAIGFLQEALRWWDHWLKGIDTGIMDEPMLASGCRIRAPPPSYHDQHAGRWVAEESWPSPRLAGAAGAWSAGCWPTAQRGSGRGAADPLAPDTGRPRRRLLVPLWRRATTCRSISGWRTAAPSSSIRRRWPRISRCWARPWSSSRSRPTGRSASRLHLFEVLPDGAVARVTYGVLNLTHRESHEHPTPLEPGKRYQVKVEAERLSAIASPPAHRLRLAVSTAYWPMVWPSPEASDG